MSKEPCPKTVKMDSLRSGKKSGEFIFSSFDLVSMKQHFIEEFMPSRYFVSEKTRLENEILSLMRMEVVTKKYPELGRGRQTKTTAIVAFLLSKDKVPGRYSKSLQTEIFEALNFMPNPRTIKKALEQAKQEEKLKGKIR